jgi:hypothetical protein
MLIRCYAEGRSGSWEGVCLDFDIAVNGKTFEEVLQHLDEAIALYLERLAELPEDERRRLLRRRSPLAMRVKFLWHVLRNTLWRHDGPNDKGRAEFTLPCTT